ncbi:unnamed protein product [Schistocephalus solidus]|uniref:Methylmalonic aciduria and homocystinuria type D homolog n=1 Tax=Schistocephalus solidus TaxID=70667 RepID=A0A3P7EUW0_SCHSO|nr:unnamed protein product [Schistocephalus solidus]
MTPAEVPAETLSRVSGAGFIRPKITNAGVQQKETQSSTAATAPLNQGITLEMLPGITPLIPAVNSDSLDCQVVACSQELLSEFAPLFPGNDLSNLTAVTLAHRTKCNIFDWNEEMAAEREELADYFSEAAKEMCTYLNNQGYWADYIDPYTCQPALSGTTSDALTETDARLKRLGFLIDDIACCKILRHQRWGHQVSVGVVFTNAPPSLPMLANLQPSSLGFLQLRLGLLRSVNIQRLQFRFQGELPVAKCRPPGEPTDPVSPDLGVGDAGLIDQAYFREQPDKDPSMVTSNPSVADFILGVRDQLSINQYTGHTIDFEERWQAAVFLNRRDSQGFRIPDDDAVKFYRLTEDEATEVLRHCIIFNQGESLLLN